MVSITFIISIVIELNNLTLKLSLLNIHKKEKK